MFLGFTYDNFHLGLEGLARRNWMEKVMFTTVRTMYFESTGTLP